MATGRVVNSAKSASPGMRNVRDADIKRLMLGHAFCVVDTVVFRVHSRNLRSQRAVEKLGATRTGTEIDPEGRGDNVIFSLAAPAT
jgi:RimJ/RimL family protein N-acetyltransferase